MQTRVLKRALFKTAKILAIVIMSLLAVIVYAIITKYIGTYFFGSSMAGLFMFLATVIVGIIFSNCYIKAKYEISQENQEVVNRLKHPLLFKDKYDRKRN